MNQIKELKNKNKNKNRFIIEITLLLLESQKKLTISLFLNASVTVLEIKEKLSKDFEYPIKSMIFFYPPKGIIPNTFKFIFEPNKKILLDLIIDGKNSEINKINREIALKNNDFQKLPNNIHFNNNLLNDKNKTNLINNYIKPIDNNNLILNPNKELINPFINNKGSKNENINYSENQNNNKINQNLKNIQNVKNVNLIYNNNLSNTKNFIKYNFFLTKKDSKQQTLDENFLGKKRNCLTTFKTTIESKKNENIECKNSVKTQNNHNFKIVNFNVNKNLVSQNKKNVLNNSSK